MNVNARPLRVLWVTNLLLPEACSLAGRAPGVVGGWMPALAGALRDAGTINLAVATMVPGAKSASQTISGIKYYIIPSSRGSDRRYPSPSLLEHFRCVVEDFRPDVIHVHGTEFSHGLLAIEGQARAPVVVSIQGLVSQINRHLSGGLSLLELVKARSLRDWLRGDGLWEQKIGWIRRSRVEKRVIAGSTAVIGRTLWDKAHTRALRPDLAYFHCAELLRPEFYEAEWQLERAQPHSIFTVSAEYPYKGFHWLLRAVAVLKHDFPDIKVRVALAGFNPSGSRMQRLRQTGYAKYLQSLVNELHVADCVDVLGPLSASRMAQELTRAHVFALPSMIENSPNALAEAMVVGTPSVSSFVGGVPSMVTDGETTLSHPAGEFEVLAETIGCLFSNPDLAKRLSREAQRVAAERHEQSAIADRMHEIYQAITAGEGRSPSTIGGDSGRWTTHEC